ncbi:hypothetical protein SSPS47_16600 [Streptomyces sp. S4.7]|uniref:hypothetical protein n=1 Tax=Streptomyces sp. S4.7 TaxID=2705439 RepID=UPI001396D2B2|nr:hypothetical protein [Streptomyces sp. S4.7]QHY96727.1 hypothetical protein SSPS47_16600 [Streptomyces sp. S4.7]
MPDRVAHAGASLRLLRAAVFTAVCVVLSATGHVIAACQAVPWWTLVVGFAGVLAVAAPLAGRARSLPAIALALTGGQLALHALFGMSQHHLTMRPGADDVLVRMAAKLICGAGPASLSPGDAHRIVTDAGIDPATVSGASGGLAQGGHLHGTADAALGAAGPLPELPTLPMFLAHLLAALATGWLMRRGDLALARLATLSAQGLGDGIGEAVADNARLRALRAALRLVRALRWGLPVASAPGLHGQPAPRPDAPPSDTDRTLQHSVIRRGPPAVFTLAA